MELRYKYIFIILIVIFIILYFVLLPKDNNKNKKNIANTKFIKENEYYQKRVKIFKIYLNLSKVMIVICLLLTIMLSSRPISSKVITNTKKNRDIVLCMDISYSVIDLNHDLVKSFKELINSLNGERVGITIFNTSAVTLSPLTDDYEYLQEILSKVDDAFIELSKYNMFSIEGNNAYMNSYIAHGTLENNETRGSSLIGDGLATCVSNFSSSGNRTKIVVFSTDNQLNGTPLYTFSEASIYAKKKNVLTYGFGTSFIYPNDREEYKNAMEETGGKYFDSSDLIVDNVVKEINNTTATITKEVSKKVVIDDPIVLYILLMISFGINIILNARIKLRGNHI